MLLNVLDSTRYYVGSYLSDARFRPSKGCEQEWTIDAASAPIGNGTWSTIIDTLDADGLGGVLKRPQY